MCRPILGIFLGLHLHPHALKIHLSWGRALRPHEELCRRIDLIIMLALGEDGHFVQAFGEPRRRLRYVDKAVLNNRGLRVCRRMIFSVVGS
jgi:hypothetical protein